MYRSVNPHPCSISIIDIQSRAGDCISALVAVGAAVGEEVGVRLVEVGLAVLGGRVCTGSAGALVGITGVGLVESGPGYGSGGIGVTILVISTVIGDGVSTSVGRIKKLRAGRVRVGVGTS
jgi:hypothetical protein